MINRAARPKTFRKRFALFTLALYFILTYSITAIWPAPIAVSIGFEPKTGESVRFLSDLSWIDKAGQRQLKQQIFDAVLQNVSQAESLIVLDMFLFNDWQGPVSESHRSLSNELTQALIDRKQEIPTLVITVISDPINAVYEGLPSKHFRAMREAGIQVVLTDLTQLQDSNPIYSGIWRWLIRPFGNTEASTLPNPFGPGRVSIRSYLSLLNFKANHRKLLVTDDSTGGWRGLVSSANPHDGSSAHRNVALSFEGAAAFDLLASEKALLTMSSAEEVWQMWPAPVLAALSATAQVQNATMPDASESVASSVQVLSESRIEDAVLQMLLLAQPGDALDLLMFYLSDRDIVKALIAASDRGVDVRVLLDVNQDAFGRTKQGVPNRPVAAELAEEGVSVRWCSTSGEQCHGKMLLWQHENQAQLLLGSGNYTRRNLEDFNLETNVLLQAQATHPAITNAFEHFEHQWSNTADRVYSTEYQQYANDSLWLAWRYRFMEATGFGTF